MLRDYLKENLIYIDPDISDKKKLFRFLADDLAKKGALTNKRYFLKSLIEREELGNTELYPHIAIPHCHCSSVKKLFMAIVISKKGIVYDNPDNDPANLIFLIGCPTGGNKEYLQLLATTARSLKTAGFSDSLISCTSPAQVIEVLLKHDLYGASFPDKENLLLSITLFKKDRLNDLLSALIELGVGNASVISSTSMAKRLSFDVPVFAGLKLKSLSRDTETAVVLATIADKTIPKQLASILKDDGIDFNAPGNGFMQIFTVKELIGHSDEFI